MQITVLGFYDRISLFQTLKPLLLYPDRHMFTFTNSLEHCLTSDSNSVLFMFRWFLKPDWVDMEAMKKLREKYWRIFFFNGNAGGGIPRLELLDYVDYFFSKALFEDRGLYGRRLYGDELYTDFYYKIYPDIRYAAQKERAVCTDAARISKLKLFWNIGIGDFPKKQFRQRGGVWMARQLGARIVRWFYFNPSGALRGRVGEKAAVVSARYRLPGDSFLDLHRNLFSSRMQGRPEFRIGTLGQNAYNREIASAQIVFSPFGWGEFCFRDFEAVHAGALLFKPDVSHLETWPDIFIPGETYVPLKWDASDIEEKAEYYLSRPAECRDMAQRAAELYVGQIAKTMERLQQIIELV